MVNTRRTVPVKILVLFFILLGLLGGLYVYYTSHKDKTPSDTTSSLPVSWVEYKNVKYSLEFIYPNSWGSPMISESLFQTGKHYDITFAHSPATSNSSSEVSIILDSEDAATKICDSGGEQCVVSSVLTSSVIEQKLKEDKSLFATYNNSSYATILGNIEQNSASKLSASKLSVYQVVNLPKLKVSAAQGIYAIMPSSSTCLENKFSPQNSEQNCITNDLYDTMSKILKSFKSI